MATRPQDESGDPLTMRDSQTDKPSKRLLLVCVLALSSAITDCSGHVNNHSPAPALASSSTSSTATNQDAQADLLALVKHFAEGEKADDEWKKLQSYPREQLIESLLSLQNSIPEDDCRHYSIAFTLSSLDYHYEDNVKVLAHSLTPKPNECADDVATMLARLIRAGDKNLMPVLFSSAPASDAALGEALEDIFAQEVRAEPKEFLAQLGKQPKGTKLKVYEMIANGGLTQSDVNELRKQLTALSHDPALSRVATEMLSSSVLKR